MEEFSVDELEDVLKRAFVDKGFPSILVDGHTLRNEFLASAINYGIENDWLRKSGEASDSQWTSFSYELTEEGKKYFELD